MRGGILLQLKRYEEAIESFHNMPEKDHLAYAQLAAAYAHCGDSGERGSARRSAPWN